MYFSKSKYCNFLHCPKMAWLEKYKPEEKVIDQSANARFEEGHAVGELAKNLFGEFVDVTTLKEDGSLDLPAMIEKTEEEIKKGADIICEASFSYNGLYCAVDILRRVPDGYAVYEVKSSTYEPREGKSDSKPKQSYLIDIAYQKYVLVKCGIKVINTYLVRPNKSFVKQGDIDVEKFFFIKEVSDFIKEEYDKIDANLAQAEPILDSKIEPDSKLSSKCNKPYDCAYWGYCTRCLPEDNVFTLYNCRKKFTYYEKGILSFDDLLKSGEQITDVQRKQVEFSKKSVEEVFVDKVGVRSFLDSLSYPLYFLDFETMQSVIPQLDGTRPNQVIPFQYSLHYIESEGAPLQHKEFLAESGENPLRAIAESLCENIPKGACTLVYYKTFECDRLNELADLFPDLAEHLRSIADGIIDLLVPFQKGYYYKKAMGGSFSIKVVLPAIFPNDPTLNYQNLDGVHNGSEAMGIFPKIKDMPKEEAEKIRESLLKYCYLDTFGMVKIWEELVRVSK